MILMFQATSSCGDGLTGLSRLMQPLIWITMNRAERLSQRNKTSKSGGTLYKHDQTSCHLGIKRDTMSCLLNMNDSHVSGDFIMWRWIDRFIQVNAATPMDYNEQS